MSQPKYEAIVVGAGIAGVAAAYALVKAGARRIALVECEAPLSLTSDKSTECYRNFWPGPDGSMWALINDSIDRMMMLANASGDRFQMQQRGYLFATTRPEELERLAEQAVEVEKFGGGALRRNAGNTASYKASPAGFVNPDLDGADLITSKELIRQHFPYLASDTVGVLHVRKCGALSAQQFGMFLLEEARDQGADLIAGEFTGIETERGGLSAVNVSTGHGEVQIATDALVLATGPHLKSISAIAGTELPVVVEEHVKISMADPLGVIPRDAPLIIWNDPIDLPWSTEEREVLAASPDTSWLLKTFPAGVHGRPIGAGDQVLMYWTYNCEVSEAPTYPIEPDPFLPEVTLRGMARMVPGLKAYFDPMPKPYVDGGYYTKAVDNRPIIGPLDVPGTYVCGAYSGYGIMASLAGGELLATHLLGSELPNYAPAFAPTRLSNESYLRQFSDLSMSGQL